MNWFKIFGLLLILLSATAWGFLKGNRLLKRSKALEEICISLEKLAELVKCGTGELTELLRLSFGDKNFLADENLSKEDKALFEKLLSEMGISHREKEYKQILIYKTLYKKRLDEAEAQNKKLCKLYNSLGFLIGLSICIFLI